MDMNDPESVVSPGGVGFDINCGVRLIRTNLMEKDLNAAKKEELAQELFDHIPVSDRDLFIARRKHSRRSYDLCFFSIFQPTSLKQKRWASEPRD